MNEELGAQIKLLRKNQGMTLQMLSEKSELSVSYLSMVERGLNSPTIQSLQNICAALNISLTDLFLNLSNQTELVRKDDRVEIFNDHNSVVYYSLVDASRPLQAIIMDVFDTEPHKSSRHVSDELGLILSGSMVMNVEGNPVELSSGDTFYIPAGKEHFFQRTSADVCSSAWFHYNPSGSGDHNFV